MPAAFGWTDKQIAIMTLLFKDADAGRQTPLMGMSDRLFYAPEKTALLHSMKILIKHGLVEKDQIRVKGHRNPYTYYSPTPKAFHLFRKPLTVS